jgi:hypothetical protein
MSDLISDGMTTVWWVPTIANIHAPTAAEIAAGSEWTSRFTPDGLKSDPTTADVDTSSLASTQDTTEAGRRSWDVEMTLKRGTLGTADDAHYRTLTYKTYGNWVVRRGVAYGTSIAAGQQVEVYPVVCGERINVAPAANEVMKATYPCKLTSDADTNATVA